MFSFANPNPLSIWELLQKINNFLQVEETDNLKLVSKSIQHTLSNCSISIANIDKLCRDDWIDFASKLMSITIRSSSDIRADPANFHGRMVAACNNIAESIKSRRLV